MGLTGARTLYAPVHVREGAWAEPGGGCDAGFLQGAGLRSLHSCGECSRSLSGTASLGGCPTQPADLDNSGRLCKNAGPCRRFRRWQPAWPHARLAHLPSAGLAGSLNLACVLPPTPRASVLPLTLFYPARRRRCASCAWRAPRRPRSQMACARRSRATRPPASRAACVGTAARPRARPRAAAPRLQGRTQAPSARALLRARRQETDLCAVLRAGGYLLKRARGAAQLGFRRSEQLSRHLQEAGAPCGSCAASRPK